jgi:hypothetical protein
MLIERLIFLEELNLYHLDCVYGNPDWSDILTLVKNINEILQKCYRPKLKLILPWTIMAEFFGYDRQVKKEYHFPTTPHVQFMQPPEWKSDSSSTSVSDLSSSDLSTIDLSSNSSSDSYDSECSLM